ncbi:MAG: hypothetical protein GC153_02990 [Alphaproteobacteria bacterium]|nr:hypothetical protein [Alphaproteobacteria bacterium]
MTIFVPDDSGGVVRLHALSPDHGDLVRAALAGPCGGMNEAALSLAVERYVSGDYSFERPILDRSAQKLAFNVMPNRITEERIEPRAYFVGRDIARAVFDRAYETAMDKSPSHVVFLSALVQWQKLIYLIMCHRCGLDYDPDGAERFKIWPTEVLCRMPTLVREEENLTEDAFVSTIETAGADVWRVEGFAVVNRRIGLLGKASVRRI